MKRFYTLLLLLLPLCVLAQTNPDVEPRAFYISEESDVEASDTVDVNGTTQNAPLTVIFQANPTGLEGLGMPRYEWKIWEINDPDNVILQRTEEDVEFTFNSSGTFKAQLKVAFYDDKGDLYKSFPEDYDDPKVISFSISDSKLTFPNAFSPNEDGWNDVLCAKEYQSIVQFEAAVFNRWGNKLYSWSDVKGGWDGKYNGKVVKDGIYFLVVKAKGADGRNFTFRKTITVITGYNNGENNTGTGDDGF